MSNINNSNNILDIVAARAQYIAENLATDSPSLFRWRNNIILAHGINPESGEFTLDSSPVNKLNRTGQQYLLSGIIITLDNNISQAQALEISLQAIEFTDNLDNSQANTQDQNLILRTDGASRGNPGQASIGWVLFENINNQENILNQHGEYIGTQTNNYAEYSALISGLTNLVNKNITGENLIIELDSELAVKQINKIYKVKDQTLQVLYKQVCDLLNKLNNNFQYIKINHIARSKNSHADALCNQALDNLN